MKNKHVDIESCTYKNTTTVIISNSYIVLLKCLRAIDMQDIRYYQSLLSGKLK